MSANLLTAEQCLEIPSLITARLEKPEAEILLSLNETWKKLHLKKLRPELMKVVKEKVIAVAESLMEEYL